MEPATPFWEGYKRPPERVEELVDAVRAALLAHPEQRLGQIIVNATGFTDPFNVWDEDMVQALINYTI